MSSLYVNDRKIDDLVYALTALDGHLGLAVPKPDAVPMANAPSAIGSTVTVAPRRVTVVLQVRAASFAARQVTLDALARRFAGLVELKSDDVPTRTLRGVLAEGAVTYAPSPSVYAWPIATVTVAFDAIDPHRWEVEPLPYALTTTRLAIPVGTAASAVQGWLYGGSPSVVDPVVLVRAHTGEEVMRLTLSGSLATNDAVFFDASLKTLDRYVAGVKQTGSSAGLTFFSSGRWPVLAPEDASAEYNAWGTVELSATSGTPTGLLLVQKRYV